MSNNYQYLLDKTIETQKDTSNRLAKNTFFQGTSIILSLILSFKLIEIQPIIKEYLKVDNSKYILFVLPFYLIYLFIEFGYLLSHYIACGQTKKVLTKKLIEDCEQEIVLNADEKQFVNITFKSFNFYEPMANPFGKTFKYSFITYFPTIFSILIIGLNHFSILYISETLIPQKIVFLTLCIFLIGITIPFYLHFYHEHKNKDSINRITPWLGISVTSILVLLFILRTIFKN